MQLHRSTEYVTLHIIKHYDCRCFYYEDRKKPSHLWIGPYPCLVTKLYTSLEICLTTDISNKLHTAAIINLEILLTEHSMIHSLELFMLDINLIWSQHSEYRSWTGQYSRRVPQFHNSIQPRFSPGKLVLNIIYNAIAHRYSCRRSKFDRYSTKMRKILKINISDIFLKILSLALSLCHYEFQTTFYSRSQSQVLKIRGCRRTISLVRPAPFITVRCLHHFNVKFISRN